jgi:hypothetical protein
MVTGLVITILLAAALGLPAAVRAFRLWRAGPPDFKGSRAANDER